MPFLDLESTISHFLFIFLMVKLREWSILLFIFFLKYNTSLPVQNLCWKYNFSFPSAIAFRGATQGIVLGTCLVLPSLHPMVSPCVLEYISLHYFCLLKSIFGAGLCVYRSSLLDFSMVSKVQHWLNYLSPTFFYFLVWETTPTSI